MSLTAREAALKALASHRQNGVWPAKALDGLASKAEMSIRETALAARILNGVLQNLFLLDFYIGKFSTIEIKKTEPQVLDILRTSAYQLIFMKIPRSAAVNEGVKLAKKRANPRAAGFVNAVLRKIAEAAEKGSLPEIAEKDETVRLSIKYSHPKWLLVELFKTLNPNSAESFLAANNSDETPVTVQVNTLLTDIDAALRELRTDGADAVRHEWLDNCIVLRRTGNIVRLSAFNKGFVYVQDTAARLSVMAAGIKQGDRVIDGCAAPGGKSFAAAIAMENTGEIIACDISEPKLHHIEEGARRLGIGIIKTRSLNAAERVKEFTESADVVIADVPCSGFGVIRKKPEIRYKMPEDIEELPSIQKRILLTLSSYVKPCGVLIYSTCTVLRRENEDVIDWFLRECGGFTPEDFALPGVGQVKGGMVTLWPHIHGTDGFFICKLRKKA